MNNIAIIEIEKERLAKEGVLKYTGRSITVTTADGDELEVKEIQPIHTFNRWKQLGYRVKKGEKSFIKFPIWKYSTKKGEDEEETEQKRKEA